LAFGGQNSTVGNTFVGTSNFFLTGEVNPAFWFYEYAFSATSATIVAGAIAERCQMIAYLCYSVFLTAFVYPVVAHAVWSRNGFLSVTSSAPLFGCGVLDFAGSGVVHVTGGSVSLIAVLILGARQGRFTDARGRALEEPAPMPGHSIALQLLGTMLLWFSCKPPSLFCDDESVLVFYRAIVVNSHVVKRPDRTLVLPLAPKLLQGMVSIRGPRSS
jgi:Amt family ammonium transporter